MVQGKVGSRTGPFPDDHQVAQNWYFGQRLPKGVFLETPDIENGTQIDQRRQDRHQDPLKKLPGSGFGKT